jgi:pyrimidine deaminase RibD-like protein
MKLIIALVAGLALTASAFAACEGVTPEKDGVSCAVVQTDSGRVLHLQVHARKGDPEARVGAAKAATQRAIERFINEGGVFIKMRSTRTDGVAIERTCSKIKGKKIEHCGAWSPVKG